MILQDNHKGKAFFYAGVLFCALVQGLATGRNAFGQPCTLSGVAAGNDLSITCGDIIQLKAIATGGIAANITYSWTPVTGLDSPNAAITNAHPTVTTSYQVTATEGTCTVSDLVTVTVNQLPLPDFGYVFVGPECNGNLQFTISTPSDATGMTYVWNFGDPNSELNNTSALRNPTHIFASYGSYQVSLIVVSKAGCQSSINKTFNYITIPDPSLNNSVPFINCLGNGGSIGDYKLEVSNASATTSTNVSYSIDWGDGAAPEPFLSTFTKATHNYSGLGKFDLVFTVIGSNGCSKSKIYAVFNGSNPALTVGSPGNTTGCIGTASFEFPISGTENNVATTYSFDFGDGTIENYNQANLPGSVKHTYLISSCLKPNGYYHLIATATNPCITTRQDISPIIVSEPPKATYTFAQPHTGCINKPVTFTNNSQNGCYILGQAAYFRASYKWYIDNVEVQTDPNVDVPKDLNYTFTTPGIHTVCLEAWNSCNINNKDRQCQTICITPEPQASFNLDASGGCKPFKTSATNTAINNDICGNLQYTWSVTNYTASADCAPGVSDWDFDVGSGPNSLNPGFVFRNAGMYEITQTASNSCGSVSASKTISVLQPPTVSIVNIPAVCQTFPATIVNPTATVTNCGVQQLNYSWTFTGGNPATSTSAIPGSVSYDTPGTYFVSLIVTNECGPSTIAISSFTINPTPIVNDIANQVKCNGDLSNAIAFGGTIVNTIYNWTNSNQAIGGLGVSGTGNINAFLLTNTGTSDLTSTIIVTPSFNGCTGASKNFTITVHPVPTVNNIDNLSLCSNVLQSGIVFSSPVSGTTFSWTNDSPGIGLASGGVGNIPDFTAINNGTAPTVATITVTPINLSGCPGTARTFTITVNPIPGTMILTDKAFCNGVPTTPINFTNQVLGTTYTWTNSSPAIGLPGSGIDNIPSFIPINNGIDPIQSTVTVTPSANGCLGASQTFVITINPSPVITFSPVNQTICTGENTAEVTLISTLGASISWTSVVPPGITGSATSGTNTIPVQTLMNATSGPLVVTYKAKAAMITGTICAGVEFIYTITVNPKPYISSNIPVTICSGLPFTVSPADGGGNIIPSGTTYIWNIPIISPIGTILGANAQGTPQTTISQQITNITNNKAIATYTVTPVANGCAGLPFDVIVTVDPTPNVNPVNNIQLCNGDQNTLIDFTGGVTGTTFNWVNDNTTIGIGPSGSGAIPAFTATNTGETPVKSNITVTPLVNGCTGIAITFTITVFPILPVAVSITDNNNDVCPGTNINFTATPVNGGLSPAYQWMVNGKIVGTNAADYAYTPIDGDKVVCQLTSNATCPSGNPAQSNTLIIVVNSNLPAGITIISNLNDICPGESVTFTATPFNGGSSPVYQWFVNGLKVGLNLPVFSYEPINGDVVSCQLTSSNNCSSNRIVTSAPLKLIVSPPALQPSFTLQQTNDCTPVKVILKNTTPAGGLAYIWDFGDGTIDTTTTLIDVTHTYGNFSSTPVVYNISLKVVTRFTHCFNVFTRSITVNPELIAGSPVTYEACSPFVHKFENAYAGAKSYQWITNKNAVLSTSFQPTLTFNATGKRDSTFIVYLVAESFFGCFDTIVNTIKVSPALEMPSFTYSGNPECKSVTYTFKNTSPEGADVFIWNFDDGTINKTYHANEDVTHTFYNGSDVAMPFNVTLTSTSGTYCSFSVTQQILVDPVFIAGFPVIFEGCSSLTRAFSNAFAGAKSYRWESANKVLLSNEMAPSLTFNANINRDSTYLVYLIAESIHGCIDTIVNKVIVRAANKAEFTAIPTEGCSPLAVKFTNTSSSLIKSFQWDFNDGSDYSIIENPNHIFIDPNGADVNYNVSLIGYNQYGCADTAIHLIHLLPTPQVNFIASPVEQTYPDRTIQLSNLTPAGNWTYTWNFGDQKPVLTGDITSYTYDFPGKYVISLTAKGALCQSVGRTEVVIDPGIPSASFEPDTSGCAPLKVNFRNNSQNGSRYLWDFGNGTQSVDFSPSITYFNSGTFTVKLSVYNLYGAMSTFERTIVVLPETKALFKPLPIRVRIPGQTVTFFNLSENGVDFLWNFGDGSTSTDIEPIHQYLQTGLFNVSLLITSAEGCKDSILLANAVEAFSNGIEVPNAFMPSKDGSSGGRYVPGDSRNSIFYPSVAAGDVVDYELVIYNRWGNLLFSTREVGQGWDGYYNGRLCSQDVYIWKIKCKFKSGTIITKTGDVTLIQ